MLALCNVIAVKLFLTVVGFLVGGCPVQPQPSSGAAPQAVTISVSVERDTTVSPPQELQRPQKPQKSEKPVKITITDEGIKIGSEGKERVILEVDSEKLGEQIKKSLEGIPESLAAVFGEDEDSHYHTVRSSDLVTFAKSINVAQDELVNGDVVAFGSDINIEGKVMGDVAAIFGDVTLGPDAIVNGQVVSILGSVTKEEGAVVRGETAVVGRSHHGRSGPGLVWAWGPPLGKGLFGASAKIILFIVLVLLMLLILYFISGRMKRAAAYLSGSFLKSLGIGILVLFPGTLCVVALTIILAITIVGIPVAVLLVMSLFALSVLGFFTSALGLGAFVSRKLNIEGDSPYVHGIIGLFLLSIVGIIASFMSLNPFFGPMSAVLRVLGFFINFAALVLGIGAFIASKGGSRSPLPKAPPAA